MRQYFSTFRLIGGFLPNQPETDTSHPLYLPAAKGFVIAGLASLFIYLSHMGYTFRALNTLSGLLALYLLLRAPARTWFWSGFFTGLFWFWWIGMSFIHYKMVWAIPLVELGIALIYGGIFWIIAKIAERLAFRKKSIAQQDIPIYFTLSIKAIGLLILSYIHPFTFDWFKPELIFVESYFGIKKWQFALILASLVLFIREKRPLFLLLLLAAYSPQPQHFTESKNDIALVTLHTSVEEKWDSEKHPLQFQTLLRTIDRAIEQNKTLVILPESVFPVFLNHEERLFSALQMRAKKINIVTGALYWDGQTPRNAAYIFKKDGSVTVANKVILVPFGEANPLPDFLSKWVNRIFYDNAVDYQASSHIVDYTIDGITYRNAICFEATSETLYRGNPEQMIVLSNNGWFTPSVEPTLQRLLLQYYSRKYGTTIYHVVNMAPSYIIQKGKVILQ